MVPILRIPSLCNYFKNPSSNDIACQNELCYNCLVHHKVSLCTCKIYLRYLIPLDLSDLWSQDSDAKVMAAEHYMEWVIGSWFPGSMERHCHQFKDHNTICCELRLLQYIYICMSNPTVHCFADASQHAYSEQPVSFVIATAGITFEVIHYK